MDAKGGITTPSQTVTWMVRGCFALVFCLNVICALQFIIDPEAFVGAYELEGTSGNIALQGLGIAFLMWNATYPAFVASPRRFVVLGYVILAQQLIGLIGETLLLFSLPAGHDALAQGLLRFACFDAVGLALMGVSFFVFLAHRRA